MSAELPDVRVGDVWRDEDRRDDRDVRTVTVERRCADEACMAGKARRSPYELPHAHVVASPSGRPSVIAIRRFRPGRRGYTLVRRDGQAVES